MKKSLFPALLFLTVMGLSVTSAYALEAGCSPAIRDMQKHHSDAMRVRDKAYAHQIIKRNDSTLALTCFDQSLKRTSRLGQIFSDKMPTDAPPADTTVFGGEIAYPDQGLSNNLLASNLNKVITPTLNKELGNFPRSPTAVLGSLNGNALNTMMGSIRGDLSQISQAQNAVQGQVSSINATISQINSVIGNVLPSIPPLGVPSIVGMVNGLIASEKGMISSLTSQLASAVTPSLGNINTTIMGGGAGAVTGGSLGGFSADPSEGPPEPQGTDCSRMENLWNDGDIENGAQSIEGGGIEGGTPYVDMEEFVSGSPRGMGEDFTTEISNPTDSAALNAAMTDLTTLNEPGGIDSYPVTPTFAENAETDAIINGM